MTLELLYPDLRIFSQPLKLLQPTSHYFGVRDVQILIKRKTEFVWVYYFMYSEFDVLDILIKTKMDKPFDMIVGAELFIFCVICRFEK